MTTRSRFLAALATFAITTSFLAEATPNPNLGPNITRIYTTAELSSSYGILAIAKDELWMLNFPDTVTDVLTTREGVLDTKMMGNTVALAAILPSGQLPVAIKLANGLTLYFLVTLSPSRGGGIRNIVVKDPSDVQAPTPAIPAVKVTPQPTSAAGGTRYAVQPVKPFTAPAIKAPAVAPAVTVPAATPAPAVRPAPTVSPRNQQESAPPAPTTRPATSAMPMQQAQVAALPGGTPYPTSFPQQPAAATPEWVTQAPAAVVKQAPALPLQAQFALQLDGNAVVLYYRLNNPGSSLYALNDQQIRVSNNGTLLPVTGRGTLTLAPGASTYGTVTLPSTGLEIATGLAVEWNALQQDTGTVTVLRSYVTVQQASMPSWKRLPMARVFTAGAMIADLR